MNNLIGTYQKLLDLQTANFSLIDHEEAMVATVYKITQPNGDQFVLKISGRSNDFLREVYFLNHFADIIPVPKIIQVVEPTKEIPGAILMEYLSGILLKTTGLTESLANELGRCLALIHTNRLPGYGDPIEGDLNIDPRVYFTFKLEEGLKECKDHLPVGLIKQCQSYYEANIDRLRSVDGPCIVHRDFRPGNLIVHDGKLQGIIDWAGARASFAEEDFCSIEHGEWLNNPHHQKAFLFGYGSIRSVPDYKSLIPFLRLNKAIATIGFTIKRGTWKTSSSRLYQNNRQFLDTFFKENL